LGVVLVLTILTWSETENSCDRQLAYLAGLLSALWWEGFDFTKINWFWCIFLAFWGGFIMLLADFPFSQKLNWRGLVPIAKSIRL
jgi:hypothetical protein